MKFVPHRDLDLVTSALTFTTPDLHVVGGCDLYTTKAAGGDKKLYKNIENDLEAQYRSDLQFSHSLSPPQQTAMASSLNLSRSSPFGNLGIISARRTYAYLIATLNASHPDYDFSNMLRPTDFKREKSLRSVMNNIDTTLFNLRPSPVNSFAGYAPTFSAATNSAPVSTTWGPGMWRLIDQQMSLRECAIYRYAPEEFDPFEDDEEGALWSTNYFFFNKTRKRVCYLYLRGISILAAKSGADTPLRTPVKNKREMEDDSDNSLVPVEAGARKRAKYWFGGQDDLPPPHPVPLNTIESPEDRFSPPKRPVVDDDDQYLLSDEETRSARGRSRSTMRGMSEEAIGRMEEEVVGHMEV